MAKSVIITVGTTSGSCDGGGRSREAACERIKPYPVKFEPFVDENQRNGRIPSVINMRADAWLYVLYNDCEKVHVDIDPFVNREKRGKGKIWWMTFARSTAHNSRRSC